VSDSETFYVLQEIDAVESISMTDLRQEIKLMHSLRMRKHIIVMFETDGIGQTPVFAWTLFC